MILYVEHTVNAKDLTTALWRFCNNLDPKRDNILYKNNSAIDPAKPFTYLVLAGPRKPKELNNLAGYWPNINVAIDNKIKTVNEQGY